MILNALYEIGIQVIGGIVTGCVLKFFRYYRRKNDRHSPEDDH